MRIYLVIGNPIAHSLSPKLHNHWIKANQIDAIYEKKEINDDEIKNYITEVRQKKINGINVTVPFKSSIIPFLDTLSPEAKITQSVNTIFLDKGKVVGHNTDIEGFEKSIKHARYEVSGKKVLILGSGGVVPSIIFALQKMKALKIIISNRTKEKAKRLKKIFEQIDLVDWGEIPDFDMIINATSVGLKKEDTLGINFSKIGKNKFFYDVIYNPKKTKFLKIGEELGNKIENGKMMFIYQAQKSFQKWNEILPEINKEVEDLLDD
tara:strand:+ start:2328 stop:3122 length:795 start_codon:yes stop_codon:yes gene_type:complete